MRGVETSAEEPQPAPPNPQTPGITAWNPMQGPFNSKEKHKGVDEGDSGSTCISPEDVCVRKTFVDTPRARRAAVTGCLSGFQIVWGEIPLRSEQACSGGLSAHGAGSVCKHSGRRQTPTVLFQERNEK